MIVLIQLIQSPKHTPHLYYPYRGSIRGKPPPLFPRVNPVKLDKILYHSNTLYEEKGTRKARMGKKGKLRGEGGRKK